ncbi:MAG: CBS domain-containing protein [Bacillota bacterium]|nr:CBS domain-containing protein [Bacillota bacterium]
MKVKDIMTKSVAYVNPSNTVVEAAQLMQKHNVGVIPVCDQSGVIGLVTDRDIVVRNIAHGKSPLDTPVKDVMTSQVTSVSPESDVDEASKIMSQNQIRRLPVVENNKLVGIIALGDMAADSRFDTEASAALSDISMPAKPEKL